MHFTPQIPLKLDGRGSRTYYPGDTLAGSYFLDELGDEPISAVEVSVLWQTEGKGNPDFGIHEFWRRSTAEGNWIDNRTPGRFITKLPNSPLSYDGDLIKICWLIRIRVFMEDGREIVDEHAFRLGSLTNLRILRMNAEKADPSLKTKKEKPPLVPEEEPVCAEQVPNPESISEIPANLSTEQNEDHPSLPKEENSSPIPAS